LRGDVLARSFALALSREEEDVRFSPAYHLVAAAVVLPVLAGVGGAGTHRDAVPRIGPPGADPSTLATVRVIARDYALQAPDTLRAGRVEFELRNDGNVAHELIVGLLRPGTTSADIMAAHQRGLTLRQLPSAYLDGVPGGVLLAAPGKTSAATLTVPLASGREYVLLCQLRDTVGGPTHAMLGMFRLLHVK
jgi:hypothetical protein